MGEKQFHTPSGAIHFMPYCGTEGYQHVERDGSIYRFHAWQWVLIHQGSDYTTFSSYATLSNIYSEEKVNAIDDRVTYIQQNHSAEISNLLSRLQYQESKLMNVQSDLMNIIQILIDRIEYLENKLSPEQHDLTFSLTGKPGAKTTMRKLKLIESLRNLNSV
jgi:hypothetical protein